MNRKRNFARELALQYLYQRDLLGSAAAFVSQFLEYWGGADLPDETRDWVYAFVSGYIEKSEEVDARLLKHCENWDMNRIAIMERNCLRLGTYELLEMKGESVGIIMNGWIDLAKKFGTERSGGFVNGILDKVNSNA